MPEETNAEQTLADIEREFESARRRRDYLHTRFEVAKAKYHRELTARRDAGEEMTIPDMKALELVALDDDEIGYVKEAYLALERAEDDLSEARLKFNEASRNYWDQKEVRR